MLVAPLNWGLGHASRCIPIIRALIQASYEPVLASDGEALSLLRKEFPKLRYYELPEYNIRYAKWALWMPLKIALQLPHIIRTLKKERKVLEEIIKEEQLTGIISDNRFGMYSESTPSVYITHQIRVFSGLTTGLTTALHRIIVNKYDCCWVPDYNDSRALSGALGHVGNNHDKVKYIGPLSRFSPTQQAFKYDIIILLSGPEPQRSLLETKITEELQEFNGTVCLVRGIFEPRKPLKIPKDWEIRDHLLSNDLEAVIAKSKLVISRSGYSTIMDLAAMGKKAIFIPTPGQQEQIYLAKQLDRLKIAPFFSQSKFNKNALKSVEDYSGFSPTPNKLNSDLFEFFKGK